MNRYHHRDLYNLLISDQKAAIPVLDPTQGDILYYIYVMKSSKLILQTIMNNKWTSLTCATILFTFFCHYTHIPTHFHSKQPPTLSVFIEMFLKIYIAGLWQCIYTFKSMNIHFFWCSDSPALETLVQWPDPTIHQTPWQATSTRRERTWERKVSCTHLHLRSKPNIL